MSREPDFLSTLNLPNAGSPLPGIVTAGQPDARQFELLARGGVTTVIDLRLPGEPRGFDEPATVSAAGLEYHNIPVGPSLPGDAQFDAFRERMSSEHNGKVLVHCATANRVGALLIPYLMLDKGHTSADAVEIARSVGLRSDDLARAALTYAEKRQKKN